MKRKISHKMKWPVRAVVCLMLAVFFILPFAEKQEAQALTFETDEDNDIEFEITHTAASAGVAYKYATGAWYIKVKTKETTSWNGATEHLEEVSYDDALEVGGEPYKTNPSTVTSGQAYTAYYKIDGQALVDFAAKQYEKNKDDLHNGVTNNKKKVEFIANKLTYAYETSHYVSTGDLYQYGPFYNLDDFWNCPQEVWGIKWGGTKNEYKKFYGQTAYVTLKAASFSIQVEDTSTGTTPIGYHVQTFDEFPYNEVFYKEEIPSIAYPGELDGYDYKGYEWRSGSKVLTDEGGTGTATGSFSNTTKSKIGTSLTLVFLYTPKVELTPVPTSVPVVATPTPEATPTPTPEVTGDIKVTFDADGGYVSTEYKYVTYGETYGQLPTPTKTGYSFYGWFYSWDGSNPDIGSYPMVTSLDNVLVNADHTLIAMWTKAEESAGPTATPTPEPTPAEDEEWYKYRYNYYTTDKGYTLDAIANNTDNSLAGIDTTMLSVGYGTGGRIPSAAQTKRSRYYSKGTDSSGNTWYFIADGTNATYVHPAVYNGYNACTEEVANITELTIPSTITYNGTSYTVTSVGGGGATYHAISSTNGTYEDYDYQPHAGEYRYVKSGTSYYYNHEVSYLYGVIGNGHIISYGNIDIDSTTYDYKYSANDYYVYNTTLKKLTVPSGVEILDGAFRYCQALTEVDIAGAKIFGESSFQTAVTLTSQISKPSGTHYYDKYGTHIYENIRYLYNESYSESKKTDIMLEWEEWSVLAPKAEFTEFTSAITIQRYAFAYRTNMYDVVLGTKLSTVESNAFYCSKLDCLTFKGTAASIDLTSVQALGTKGTASRTKIYCDGGASGVIKYGMKWHEYYELVCGYTVTYVPNGGTLASTGKEENYVTKTKIQSILPEHSKITTYIYDVNGHVWYYSNGLLQKIDSLASYNIVNFVKDKDKNFYWFETSDGGVYVAYMTLTYERNIVHDVAYVFNVNNYNDYGYGGVGTGTSYTENGSSPIYYGAYVDTESSTASKRYKRFVVKYTSSDGITITTSTSKNKPEYASSSSSSSIQSYWTTRPSFSYNGTKVTASVYANASYGTKTATYTGSGSGYTSALYLSSVNASSGGSSTTNTGTVSTRTLHTHNIYALKESAGIRSVVYVANHYTTGSNGTSYSVGINGTDLPTTLSGLYRYSGSGTTQYFIGKGADGNWYMVRYTGQSDSGGGDGYSYSNYSASIVYGTVSTMPSGLSDIAELYCIDGTLLIVDTDGAVWMGTVESTKPANLTKQTLPESIVEVRKFDSLFVLVGESGATYAYGPKEGIGEQFGLTEDLTSVTALTHLSGGIDVWDYVDYGIYLKGNSLHSLKTGEELFYSESGYNFDYIKKDLVIVGNRLYELSTTTYLVDLGDTYTIYDEMIVTNGEIYRRKDGTAIMEEGTDFQYTMSVSSDVFLNNGILYFKETLEEVPGVTDSYKFVFEAEAGDLMERYGYDFRFWNTAADDSGDTYYPGGKKDLTADITLYAQWKEKYNIIRFEPGADNVRGSMDDVLLPVSQTTAELPENQFVRAGYSFAGWGIAENGGVLFKDGEYIGNVKGMVILYAQWKKNIINYSLIYMKYPYGSAGNAAWKSKTMSFTTEETIEGAPYSTTGYTVSYNINTQSSMSTASTARISSLTLENTMTEAPEFDKWKWYETAETEPGGYAYMGTSFYAGDVVSGLTEKNGDIVYLYPAWKGEDSRVILPSGTCEGYYLSGWSEYADGNSVLYSPSDEESGEESSFTPVKDTLLYAVWTPEEKYIALDGMGADKQEQTEVVFTFDSPIPDTVVLPVRERYVFMGYYTELDADGSPAVGSIQVYDKNGNAFTDSAGAVMVSNNKNGTFDAISDTLYAYWVPDKAIDYDPNYAPLDEDCPEMETTWIDSDQTGAYLTKNAFTKTGYHFVSWNTEPDGSGTSYRDGQYVGGITTRVTLYAQWEANEYTVQYAPDSIDNNPEIPEPGPGDTWSYDEEYTIGGQPYEKHDKVSYDLNRDDKSTVPKMVTTLMEVHTKSVYRFIGWQLYEKTDSGYTKMDELFAEGDVASNLTATDGKAYVLFPVWEEIPDGVTLPEASCTGYHFRGWTKVQTADSMAASADILTKGTTYVTEKDTTLYAYWTPKEYEVALDARGATSEGHTESVTMTFDEKGPDIVVPVKTGYTFHGYFTGTRGTGTKYYDEDGICVKAWTEDEVTILYAYWIQDAIELPKPGDRTEPTPLPEQDKEGSVGRTDAKGLLYADDYNASTGALTDLQPYLSYDTPASEGAIPGTEELSFRAKLGAWMLSYKFHRFSGTDYVRIYVEVPYRTQYELENEELVISEQQTAAYSFVVPKTWSYWEVLESGMYYPDKVTVTNEALKDGSITMVVDRSSGNAVEIPSYEAINYGEKEEHVFWEEYDTDGMPMLFITLSEEQYIISYEVGSLPDIDPHLTIVCENAAWEDDRQASVRSDRYVFDGETVLSDALNQDGNGSGLSEEKLPENADAVDFTSYLQTYKSGIELDEYKANGTYATTAVITYTGDASNIGTPETKDVELVDIIGLKIHTPVACDGVAVDGIGEENGENILVLRDALNFFTLRIDNIGTHRLLLGYGTGDFAFALSGKSNVATENGNMLNQVKFPFDVFVDIGNDTLQTDGTWNTDGDCYLQAGTWMTMPEGIQRFYLPVTQKNGTFQVKFRTVAVNCPKEISDEQAMERISQEISNTDSSNYVAVDYMTFQIKSYLRDFIITDTDDISALEHLKAGNQALTLKKGYGFSYQLLTQGEFYGIGSEIEITPEFFWVSQDGEERHVVSLYQMAECLKEGEKTCYAWTGEPLLENFEERNVILQSWEGSGKIPANVLCVAENTMQGYCATCEKWRYVTGEISECQECWSALRSMQQFSVEEYMSFSTITGKEEFFKKDGYLVLHFIIRVKSEENVWYTFTDWESTQLSKDAVTEGWSYVPGDVIRYDLSKSIMDDYEVGGVE